VTADASLNETEALAPAETTRPAGAAWGWTAVSVVVVVAWVYAATHAP
jgi:hypothetical protein